MQVAGCRMRDAGCRMQDAGCRMQDAGCRMQDAGCRMQDAGCRMQDAGCGLQDAGWENLALFFPVGQSIRKNGDATSVSVYYMLVNNVCFYHSMT